MTTHNPSTTTTKEPAVKKPLDVFPILTVTIATATTLASVAFTTWSVADLATRGGVPLPVAVTVGLAVELLWLMLLATEWGQAVRTGRPAKALSVAGWVLAALAAGIISVHALVEDPVLLALTVLPLGAKTAWHFRTRDRAGQTLREQALSTAPTDTEEQTLAERARQLEVRRRQRELDRAEADADHADRIAVIERQGREQLAKARAHFTVAREVQDYDREIGYRQAPAARIALGSGTYVPDDASSLTTAGFGSAMAAQARNGQTPTLGTPVDQQVPTPTQTLLKGGAQVSAAEAETNRTLVWNTRDQLIEETGKAPSINALASATGLSRRTVARHLEADH
ncbi:hypothetical protein [Nocardiopsis sp. NPDC055824]